MCVAKRYPTFFYDRESGSVRVAPSESNSPFSRNKRKCLTPHLNSGLKAVGGVEFKPHQEVGKGQIAAAYSFAFLSLRGLQDADFLIQKVTFKSFIGNTPYRRLVLLGDADLFEVEDSIHVEPRHEAAGL